METRQRKMLSPVELVFFFIYIELHWLWNNSWAPPTLSEKQGKMGILVNWTPVRSQGVISGVLADLEILLYNIWNWRTIVIISMQNSQHSQNSQPCAACGLCVDLLLFFVPCYTERIYLINWWMTMKPQDFWGTNVLCFWYVTYKKIIICVLKI